MSMSAWSVWIAFCCSLLAALLAPSGLIFFKAQRITDCFLETLKAGQKDLLVGFSRETLLEGLSMCDCLR